MKTYRSITTGVFVGRQADQVEGETYEVVEVPQAKDEQIEFLNTIQKVHGEPSAPTEVVAPPTLNPTEAVYAKVRQDVAQGNVDLEHILWNSPLDLCLRLGTIVLERLREVKGKDNVVATN